MQKTLSLFALSFALFLILGCQTTGVDQPQGTAKKLYVIVHKDNPVQSIDAPELKRIYMGKVDRWPESSLLISRYDYPPAQQAFYEQVLGISMTEVNRYWTREKIMAGKRRPLSIMRVRDMFPRFRQELGGIGYVTTTNLPAHLKVLAEFDIVQ